MSIGIYPSIIPDQVYYPIGGRKANIIIDAIQEREGKKIIETGVVQLKSFMNSVPPLSRLLGCY